ncbi:hypothetical protein ASC77_11150 [Nocardioides sp. Root1257]|uniref:DUF6912 family protein n=1 Tax=unclassified Nocardioides TaxID=2615069 RepID=UPI0006FB2BA7|nr:MULTISPECIES: hypothetical protein [unclassified Nocardioides]KQW49238.1 hypothetical protein ASC77_11150 [Nocardioides sp. Root1257]KRC48412.1 hypothetical protein ASE24_11155 [Nocardioides sp. Root224]
MTTRIYLPLTVAGLADLHASGEVTVTDDAVVAPDDSEDGEYAALMTAADASAGMLAGPGRRIVVVAELEKEPETGWTVPLKRLVAVHADPEDRPVDADPDEDLGWYGVQEIPTLLGSHDGE